MANIIRLVVRLLSENVYGATCTHYLFTLYPPLSPFDISDIWKSIIPVEYIVCIFDTIRLFIYPTQWARLKKAFVWEGRNYREYVTDRGPRATRNEHDTRVRYNIVFSLRGNARQKHKPLVDFHRSGTNTTVRRWK